jgi:hypothetical protein
MTSISNKRDFCKISAEHYINNDKTDVNLPEKKCSKREFSKLSSESIEDGKNVVSYVGSPSKNLSELKYRVSEFINNQCRNSPCKVGPVDDFSLSEWRDVKVDWRDELLCSQIYVEYPYRAHICKLFTYDNNAER